MFSPGQDDFVQPTVDVSALEAPLDPPRASSPWTPSYSVSVQGVSNEPTESELEADGKVDEQAESASEPIVEAAANPVPESIQQPTVEVSALETTVDPPSASSPWTASYSVSIQGSPLPVSAELVDSGLEADVDDVHQSESAAEEIVEAAAHPVPESIQPAAYPTIDVSGLEASSDSPRASSPWTPSYSVSVQGVSDELMDSRLEGDDVVDKVEQPEPAAEQILEAAVPDSIPMVDVSAVEATVDPPRASSPWTPSYSVSVQGSPLPVSAELVDSGLEADADVDQPESASEPIVDAAADPVPESIQQPTVEISALEAAVDPPRASSPWTASYSVSVQGTAELVDSGLEADADDVDQPESTAEAIVEAAADHVPESIQQPTVEVSALEAAVAPPRASSPWTASYSVSVQGSPLPVSAELVDSALEADVDDVDQPESTVEVIVEAAAALSPNRSSRCIPNNGRIRIGSFSRPTSCKLSLDSFVLCLGPGRL
ncbi:hypothetical protein B0H13DRAFT_847133 [Mycena leptocephala]|nr:hypothetical protein B0H13DRAFT_847133 [Mycena leptocephala]